MTELIHIAILLLAIFRLTRMLHSESLPFNIGSKFRFWLPDSFLSRHWLTSWIVDLFACPYCLMVYSAIGVYFLNKSELGYTVIVILAMSAGGMFIWEMFGIFDQRREDEMLDTVRDAWNTLAGNRYKRAHDLKGDDIPSKDELFTRQVPTDDGVRIQYWDVNSHEWITISDNSETETD